MFLQPKHKPPECRKPQQETIEKLAQEKRTAKETVRHRLILTQSFVNA